MPKPHPLDGTYAYFDSQLAITVQNRSTYELDGLNYEGRFTFSGTYSVELAGGHRYSWPVQGGTVNALDLSNPDSKRPKVASSPIEKVGYEVGFVIFSPNVREPDPNHGNEDLSRFIDAWAGFGSPDPTTGTVTNLQLRFVNVTFAPNTWAGFSWQPTWNDFGARSYIRVSDDAGPRTTDPMHLRAADRPSPPTRSEPSPTGQAKRDDAYELHMGDGRFLRVGPGFSDARVQSLLHSIGWSDARRSSQSTELSRAAELHAELGAEISRAAEHGDAGVGAELARVAELHAALGTELSHAAELGGSSSATAEMTRAAELGAELHAEIGGAAEHEGGPAFGAEVDQAAELSAELSAELHDTTERGR